MVRLVELYLEKLWLRRCCAVSSGLISFPEGLLGKLIIPMLLFQDGTLSNQ